MPPEYTTMRQVRTVRYREIAADLRRRIAEDRFGPERLLPSEAALSRDYGASRVTVRRALESLREEGLVSSRQGFGWFVADEPLQQRLAHLETIESQLEAEGRRSRRKILEFEFGDTPPRVREILAVPRVLRVRRLNLADDEPFAIVTVWCPEPLAEDLSVEAVAARSFYENLPITLSSATQTIAADTADSDDAHLLDVAVGSPVLRCRRITRDDAGEPVLLGEYVFPGDRTEFSVELEHPLASIGPSGLRLVE